MKEIKELVLEDVLKEIDERIIHSREMYKVTMVAMEVLSKLDGKKITKRFGQKVQEALPNYQVLYDTNHHSYHITIRSIRKVINNSWDEGLLNVNSGFVNLLIGYSPDSRGNDGRYNHEIELDYAHGYLACKDEADELERIKKSIPEAVNAWNNGIKNLHKARELTMINGPGNTFLHLIFSLIPQ